MTTNGSLPVHEASVVALLQRTVLPGVLPSGGPRRALDAGPHAGGGQATSSATGDEGGTRYTELGSTGLLMEPDAATGLPSVGALIGRIGRLLGAAHGSGWSLFVAVVDTRLPGGASQAAQDDATVAVAAALCSELRFDDAVARLGPTTFLVAAPYLHAVASPEDIARHLDAALDQALDPWKAPAEDAAGHGASMPPWRITHRSTQIPSAQEADQLVQAVVDCACP